MKTYLLFLLGVLATLPTRAQLTFDSFEEVLAYADANAVAVQSAMIGEQLAVSEHKEAKSYLIPSLSGSLGYNDNITLQPTLVPEQLFNPQAESDALQELTFGTKYSYTSGMQAQWDVLNFQQFFGMQVAEMAVAESKANTDMTRFTTYNSLASTYYSLLLTQASIEIYVENVRTADSIFAQAQAKYEQGILGEAEQNRAEIKRVQNRRNLKSAQNNLAQLYVQLQSQLNTRETIMVTDEVGDFTLVNTEIQTMHPEVHYMELQTAKYESALKQTKAARLPSISFGYQYNRTWATDEFFNLSDANVLPQQSFGISLNFAGLFSPSTKQKIDQSKMQLERQQLQLENTLLVKAQEDDLLQLQLQQASDQLAENKKILSIQERNDVHAENQYEAGVTSLDQRLDRYDELLAMQDAYLQSLASYTLAQYKIYIRQIQF